MADWLGWDAEFYSSLTTTEICVSLSEQEIYLLGQIVGMVAWKTRWDGDISALDLDAISGNLEAKLIEAINCGATMACEDVVDCIEQELAIDPITLVPVNQTFYDAVTNTIGGMGFGDPNRVNQDTTTIPTRNAAGALESEISELTNCDLNALWGAIRHGIVQRLDDNARDLLENLASINDVIQRYQSFIDIVPVLGDVAEAAVTFATEVVPDILNAFNAYSSEAKMDEIACEIFSLVCSECRYPTFDEIANYYAALGYEIGDIDALSLLQIVTKIGSAVTGALPPDVIYHTIVTFELLVLYLQATFNGASGTKAITDFATLGEDSANDNWLQLCETCNEQWQIKYYDFLSSPSGWQLQPQIGSQVVGGKWTSGQGWHGTESPSGSGQYVTRIVIDINPSWRIRGIGFHYVGTGITLASTGGSFRPTAGSNTGVVNVSFSTGTNYNRSNCLLSVNQGFSQVTLIMVGDNPTLAITKAFLTFDAGYGTGDRASDRAIC